MKSIDCIVICLVGFATMSFGDESTVQPADMKFFESKIRPVLVKHCYECHAGANAEGSLRVDSRSSIRQGGDRGPAVVPKHPNASVLLTAISHADPDLKMPPKGAKLSRSAIADFRKWIELGAPDPRTARAIRRRTTSLRNRQDK